MQYFFVYSYLHSVITRDMNRCPYADQLITPIMPVPAHQESTAESWLDIVRQKVEAMRFGSVQIVVHEGRVTQVESTEKTRLAELANVTPSSAAKQK